MSSRKAAAAAPRGGRDPAEPPPSRQFRPPLRPRPTLFRVLSVVVVVWILTLLALYFTTVYPQRHAAAQPPASPPAGTVPR